MNHGDLELRVATLSMMDAALAGSDELGRALGGAAIADDWERFPEALPVVRDGLAANPGGNRWGARFFLLREPLTLVGWGGFKGPPAEGAVELGYSVAPGFEGRGIATAATAGMVELAAADDEVDVITAHTMPEHNGSTRVLEKCGFRRDPEPGTEHGQPVWVWRYILNR